MHNKTHDLMGYRWVIVLTAAAMLAMAMGVMVNGISVFFIPLNLEFGWSRGSIALINSAGLIGLAVGGVAMGGIADKTNIKKIGLFGAVVIGLCLLAASSATALWQFYLLFFTAGALGGGSLFAPLIVLVGAWFRTGAGLAIGIASAGQAIGQGGVPFGAAFLIGALGWRGALAALGIISLATLVPLALLTKEAPDKSGASVDHTADKSDVPADERYCRLAQRGGAVLLHLHVCSAYASGPADPGMWNFRARSGQRTVRDDDRGDIRPCRLRQAGRHNRRHPCVHDCVVLADGADIYIHADCQPGHVLRLRPDLWLWLCRRNDRVADHRPRPDSHIAARRLDRHHHGVCLAGARPRRLSVGSYSISPATTPSALPTERLPVSSIFSSSDRFS